MQIAIRGHALNRGGERVQDLFERATLGDQLQNVPFFLNHSGGTFQLFLVPLACGKAPGLQVCHHAGGQALDTALRLPLRIAFIVYR